MDLIQANNELGTQIVKEGLVPEEILQKILEACNLQGKHLGSTLLKENRISPSHLSDVLRKLGEYKAQAPKSEKEKNESGSPAPLNSMSIKSPFPEIHTRIGNYEILEKIARGGMGAIYKAYDTEKDRVVALKMLLSGSFASPSQIHRFLREAQTMSRLHHPNIIPVYGMGKKEGSLYLTMKYIEGHTFEKSLSENKPMEEKINTLISICHALHHAHKSNILHRDIKPSNILIDRDGTPYLVDFGLAKVLDSNSRLTKSDTVLGTPYYMSPEHTRDAKHMDCRSDVYSMGVILYQVLTGKLPYENDNLNDLFRQINEGVLNIPDHADPAIPPRLWDVCFKAMQKAPKRRYSSALAMALDLENALKNKSLSVPRFSLFFFRHFGMLKKMGYIALLCLAILSAYYFRPLLSPPVPPEIDILWNKAKKTFDEQNDSQALRYAEEILHQKPDHKDALFLQTRIFERQKKMELVRLSWMHLIELPLRPEEFESIGIKALKSGYFMDAARCFTTAFRLYPAQRQFQKLLAKAMLASGEYQTAIFHYETLAGSADTEVSLGLSTAYLYERRYEDSALSLRGVEEKSLDTYSRSCFLFIQAILEWSGQEKSLIQEGWLLQKDGVMVKGLGEIRSRLENAHRLLDRCRADDGLAAIFFQEVDAHLKGIQLEEEISSDISKKLEAFETHMAEIQSARRVFLQKTLVRCMIRNGLWEKASEKCEDVLQEYPWEYDFYSLRSLARFRSGDIGLAIMDMFKSIEKEPWNFIPIGNLLSLLLEAPTHKNLQRIGDILLSFTKKSDISSVEVALDSQIGPAVEKFLKENRGKIKPPENIEFQFLLDSFLHSQSPRVRRIALEMLAKQHNNHAFLQKIEELKKENLTSDQRLHWQELEKCLSAQRTGWLLQKLTMLIMKYQITPLPKYLEQISRIEGAGTLLENMLLNPNEEPVIRFLAAQMICHRKSVSAFEKLIQIANSDRYPENLLALSCIYKNVLHLRPKDPSHKKILGDMPKKGIFKDLAKNGTLLQKKISEMSAEEMSSQPPLYQILILLYFFEQCSEEGMNALLDSKSNVVSLCASYQSCRRMSSMSRERKEISLLRLAHFQQHKDWDIRSMALRFLWNDETFSFAPIGENRLSFYEKQWQDYGRFLLEAVRQEESRKLRLVAIFSLAFSEDLPFYLSSSPEASKNQYLLEIQKTLALLAQEKRTDDYTRFWSIMALGKLNANEIWNLLRDSRLGFFVRMGSAYGMFDAGIASQLDKKGMVVTMPKLMKTFSLLREYASNRAESADDRKFQQCTLFLFSRFNLSSFGVNLGILSNLRQWVEDPQAHPHVKTTAIACLMWQGKKSDLELLRPFFKHPDPVFRSTAAASFAAIAVRSSKNKTDKLNRLLRNEDISMRKAVAMGYHSAAQKIWAVGTGGILEEGFMLDDLELEFHFLDFRKECREEWLYALDKAMALHPKPIYLFEKAILVEKFYGYDRAYRELDVLLDLVKEKPRPEEKYYYKKGHLLKAGFLLRQNEPHKALACLNEIVKEYPTDWDIHLALGRTYFCLGDEQKKNYHLIQALLGDSSKILALMEKFPKKKNRSLENLFHWLQSGE